MDTVIGKVLDVVDTLGSDTYVIFMGDNGTPMYGTTYGNQIDNMYITKAGRGKGTPYESGCHVPMAIRGPNIPEGSENSGFVHVADLYDTILTLSGLQAPTTNYSSTGAVVDSDSRSLTPVLFGSGTVPPRDPNAGYLLTEVGSPLKVGARNSTYKVICSNNTNTSNCSFYNLIDDPLEETLLAKPGSCANYNTTWTPANPEWHYCRLIEVINNYSIF
jgi:arylsulfatase A-like enzyme